MKAWQHIINSAMLGTDKTIPAATDLAPELAEVNELIDAATELDKEDRFLQKAAVVYNYRQSGFVPTHKPEVTLPPAGAETQPYCSPQATAVLNSILQEDNDWLLRYWLEQCAQKHQLIKPELLPAVLEKAQKFVIIQSLAVACSGNRGQWLSWFNADWSYFSPIPNNEIWQTGKPEERLKALKNIRSEDPAKALQLIQETWEQENTAAKADLLKILAQNSSADDLPWLESLSGEKSQKVKDEVMTLLKTIPGSSIIQKYQEILRQSVVLGKEKGLLGLVSKTVIKINLQGDIDEAVFKSGIEKLAGGQSNISDETFIVYQLIGQVPPSFWEQQFEASPAEVVSYFDKYANTMLPALGMAVSRFKADAWINYFLEHPQFYIDFIPKLPPAAQEKYLMRFFAQEPANIIHHALRAGNEWRPAFTSAAVQFMAANPYQYGRNFFKENIGLINTNILPQRDGMATPAADNGNWNKTRDYLMRLLNLKQQIRQVF